MKVFKNWKKKALMLANNSTNKIIFWRVCTFFFISIDFHIVRFISNFFYIHIGLVGRVFANGSGDLGSIPGRVIPKTLKMVLDTSLLNTQQYKVRIKGKVEQSRERSSAPPLHLGVVAIEKGAFWSPSTTLRRELLIARFHGKAVIRKPLLS